MEFFENGGHSSPLTSSPQQVVIDGSILDVHDAQVTQIRNNIVCEGSYIATETQ